MTTKNVPFKIGETTSVFPAGARGSHGCQGEMKVKIHDVEVNNGQPYDWTVTAEILEVSPCPSCGAFEEDNENVGEVFTIEGCYDPEYYGHFGLQQ